MDPGLSARRNKYWRRVRIRLLMLPIAGVLAMAWMSWSAKRPQNLGIVNGRLYPLPMSNNCVSTETLDEERRMEPLKYSGSSAEAMERLVKILSNLSGSTIISRTDEYLHVEFRSWLFRFVDDVEFLIDDKRKVVDFRSASRVGYSDLGVNRKRMQRIQAAFVEPH